MSFSDAWNKHAAIVTGALLFGFLIGSFLLTIPTPTVTEVRSNEYGVTVKGATRPGMAVLAFDMQGEYITTVTSDDTGVFIFEGLEVTSGTREMVMRVVDGRWRSSPPKRLSLTVEILASSEPTATSTEDFSELPPPGIPPAATGTRPKPTENVTSTPATALQSLTATASVTRQNPTAKTGQTLRVDVRDQNNRRVSGATVTAVAHHTTGDVTYTLRATSGPYAVSFMLPKGFLAGTPVVVDVKAELNGRTSTARTVFTPR